MNDSNFEKLVEEKLSIEPLGVNADTIKMLQIQVKGLIGKQIVTEKLIRTINSAMKDLMVVVNSLIEEGE